MNSPLEAQLGDDLRELAASQPFAPDWGEIGRRARRRHRRGLALRGAAVAGAGALAVGGVLAAGHGPGGPAARPAAGPAAGVAASATATTRTETVAYVTGQVNAALADVNNYVLRTDQVQTGPGGISATNWTDPRTGNDYETLHDDTAGSSIAWLSSYLVNQVLTWKTVEADFATRTWFVSVMHAAGPVQDPASGAGSSVMTPAQIKQWLDSGKLKIIGHQEVNGHQAVGLRGPWADGYQELWVDSRTFLPVRFIMADFANSKGPLKNVMLVGNEAWLPRTASLLNMVNHVHIPAGFRQVAPPQ